MSGRLIFEQKSRSQLRNHELNALLIIQDYFSCDIICLCASSHKSPDIKIKNETWELKSPIGDGAKTIENILRKAETQSRNIILDFSRIKMDERQALSRTKYYLKNEKHHQIKKLLIITKKHKIIDFNGEL